MLSSKTELLTKGMFCFLAICADDMWNQGIEFSRLIIQHVSQTQFLEVQEDYFLFGPVNNNIHKKKNPRLGKKILEQVKKSDLLT